MPQEKSLKNRRSHHRYSLDRKMAYRPSEGLQPGGWKQGLVIDMSATGIRLMLSNPPAIGMSLEVVMDWPGIYHGRPEVIFFPSSARSAAASPTGLPCVSQTTISASPPWHSQS